MGSSLGQTGFVPGANPVCPWDKPEAVPKPTGPTSLSLCASFLPEKSSGVRLVGELN